MTTSPTNHAELFQRIRSKRALGKVTCDFASNPPIANSRELADAIVLASGFVPPVGGAGWYDISKTEAVKVLERILRADLAYDAPLMSQREATELSEAFLALIPDAHSYFTNGTWGQDEPAPSGGVTRGDAWNPISTATFDAGVICVGLEASCLCWVQDED